MGSQRKEVIKFIPDRPFTAEYLRSKINEKVQKKLSLREMSRHLKDFVQKEFIQCVNPDAPYNKLYTISKKGIELRREILNEPKI